MRQADPVLEDDAWLARIQQELTKRCKKSKTHGAGRARPPRSCWRMALLKHMRNWSFAVLTRAVRANLVYREFTRIGGGKVPDDKTMGRLTRPLSPAVVQQLHARVVAIAREEKVVEGRKLCVDTTVLETNIHYPTDSSLLGDGVRVLTRGRQKVEDLAGKAGAQLRDRSRSVQLRVLDIARAARSQGAQSQDKLKKGYAKLLVSTRRVVGQAKRFARDIAAGVKRSADVMRQAALEGLRKELEITLPLVQQAAENQIVIDYAVYAERPSDTQLLIPAIETHEQKLGRRPRLAAADAGFYSHKNETAAQEKGVQRVSIPNRSTQSPERKKEQKKRWFRNGQKWRTGSAGRISVLKRRHGLNRSRYKGDDGMKRWGQCLPGYGPMNARLDPNEVAPLERCPRFECSDSAVDPPLV